MAKRSSTRSNASPKWTADVRFCVLIGPEEMRKREYLDALRQVMHEKWGEFDTVYFNGTTATLADVLDEARTYSLLQPFKMVILDEAEVFLRVEGNRDALVRYAEAPSDQAVLVLRAEGGWLNYKKLEKALETTGGLIHCDPVKRTEAVNWVIKRADEVHERKIEPAVAEALVERVGTDLLRLDSELGKLAVLAPPETPSGATVTVELINEIVGHSSDEKAWAVQEAVLAALNDTGARRGKALLEKIHEIVDLADNDEVPVYYAVTDLMRKLCYAAVLRQRGVNEFMIGQRLGLWGPAKDGVLAAVRTIPPSQARRWLDRIMEMDLRARSSLGQPMRNLECFCAMLADGV